MKLKLSETSAFSKAVLLFSIALVLISISPGHVTAQEDSWQFDVAFYFWYISANSGLRSGGEIDADADDLFDVTSATFMGNAGVRKNRWSFFIDAVYFNLDDDQNVLAGSNIGLAVPADFDTDVTSWIVNPVVGYRVVGNDAFKLDIVGGARYLYIEADVNLNFTPPLPPITNSVSESADFWDGIVGVRGEVTLAPQLFIPFYLDVGTGESDLTFQAFGGIGFRYKRLDFIAGYRYLTWEFDDSQVFDDLSLHGPMGGIRVHF